jgi:predicted amidohydrolase YtcJ
MLPAFIDSHTHFVSGGFQFLMNLPKIKEYAEKNPRRWITGGDWDHELPRKE